MVYLMGAGPGDPGLVTVRAAEVLRRADVVFHDPAVSPRVLEYVRSGAEVRVADGGAWVLGRLVEAAGRGEVAVRLYAGDALGFGPGAADALDVVRAGVRLEVVPGIADTVAAPVYAGIPLPGPGAGRRLVIREIDRVPPPAPGAAPPARRAEVGVTEAPPVEAGTTALVLRLGAGADLAGFVAGLLGAGWAADLPAAVVEAGTTPRQRTIVGPLGELAGRVERAGIGGPAVAVVGDAVRLRDRLGWFEARPLFGRRIVVTRARSQAADFVGALEDRGAEVVQFPMIRTDAPADPGPLDRAVRRTGEYDWLVFTSVNGVERFWEALESARRDARALAGSRIACVGPATAAALELRGIRPDVVPSTALAGAVAAAIIEAAGGAIAGARVLLPVAAGARAVLELELQARGAEVDRVEAYRTVADTGGVEALRRQLDASEVDVITFTSPSTVDQFTEAVGTDTGRAAIATIGPVTAGAARERGLPVDVEAVEHTARGLVRALLRHFGQEPDLGV